MSENERVEGRKYSLVFFGCVVAALALTALQIALSAPQTRIRVTKVTDSFPRSPIDPAWEKAASILLPVSSPVEKQTREVRLFAMSDGAKLYLLARWADTTPDQTIELPNLLAPQGVLYRDELEIWVAPNAKTEAYAGAVEGSKLLGSWIWKSQWQQNANVKVAEEVAHAYPKEFVDMYPNTDEAVFFPARALENTNAITAHKSGGEWRVPGGTDGYFRVLESGLFAEGVWGSEMWHVMFAIPLRGSAFGTPFDLREGISLVATVVDGGRTERKGLRSVSSPVRLMFDE